MKKFAVLKKIGDFDARVVREFNEKQPWVAWNFVEALRDSEDNKQIEYAIAEVYSVDEWEDVLAKRYSAPGA